MQSAFLKSRSTAVFAARHPAITVSLRRRPPFLGRLDEGRWVIVGGVVMGSVHKLGYGHKFEGSAATSVVARGSEAGDRGGVVDARIIGVAGGAALRRECEPGLCLAAALLHRVSGAG